MFQKNLNVNEEIDSCIAETDPHLYNCIPIYFAAYFGSIKSFKYLLNHTDEKFYPSLFKYAIIGGNYDIIYLAEGKYRYDNISESMSCKIMNLAVDYMRNDLIEYLV